MRYDARYTPNQVVYGTGNIAIVTGWANPHEIAATLNKDDYAVIGYLRSGRGINTIIRHLLLNPHVRGVVVLEVTDYDKNVQAGKCLIDFLQKGFHRDTNSIGMEYWQANGRIEGGVDISIDENVLKILCDEVRCTYLTNLKDLSSAITKLKKVLEVVGASQLPALEADFPVVPQMPVADNRYGHLIKADTIPQAWVKLLQRIRSNGTVRPTGHDLEWQEIINLTVVVRSPSTTDLPAWFPVRQQDVANYIPSILFSNPNKHVKYTYGDRLRTWFGCDQIQQVIDKLASEIDAASGVMSLWDCQDHIKSGSPCLNHIWVRIVNNELILNALFRSNDMFGAWPLNAIGLHGLQHHVLERLQHTYPDLRLGPLITTSLSAHIYSDCWNYAQEMVSSKYSKIIKEENRRFDDPIGLFEVRTEGKFIVCDRVLSDMVVQSWRSKRAATIGREIANSCPAIAPPHLVYLGMELGKAESALITNARYEQDKIIVA